MKKVVAQFQLALKFNPVKNEFNNKIYELLRSPGFKVTQTVFQNKEKSQRFLWIQSMLNYKEELNPSIKSEYLQYLKMKNSLFKWNGIMQQLKNQGKNIINAKQNKLQNNSFLTAIFLTKIFKYEAAIQELQEALKTAKIDQQEAQILHQLGNAYLKQGKCPQAIQYYNRCLEIKQIINGKDSIGCAITLNGIGNVLNDQGKHYQALQYYNRCLKIQQKIKGKDSIDYAFTLNKIGIIFDEQGKCPQALQYYNRCLKIIEKIKGKDNIACAATIYYIATAFGKQAKYLQAASFYQRALRIFDLFMGYNNCRSKLARRSLESLKQYVQ